MKSRFLTVRGWRQYPIKWGTGNPLEKSEAGGLIAGFLKWWHLRTHGIQVGSHLCLRVVPLPEYLTGRYQKESFKVYFLIKLLSHCYTCMVEYGGQGSFPNFSHKLNQGISSGCHMVPGRASYWRSQFQGILCACTIMSCPDNKSNILSRFPGDINA